MIKIDKGEAPEVLVVEGEQLTESMKSDFDIHMVEYTNGVLKFKFTTAYRSNKVQEALIERQSNKCCFSEAKFVGDYPHVEHFRPKGRVDEMQPKSQMYPGYFLLAYKWSNLFLCKQLINVSYKKNFFPLEEGSIRNKIPQDELDGEVALLVDPAKDEPRNHICFHQDEPVHKDEKGKATIEYLGLKHPHFVRARETKFKLLDGLKTLIDLLLVENKDNKEYPQVKENIALLKSAMQPDAEFSSMAIDLLQDWPPLQSNQNLPQNL